MFNSKTPANFLGDNECVSSFSEVSLGYDVSAAQIEAARCLNCKNAPCMQGCPVGVKIPEFISLFSKGELEAAYLKIRQTNSLPSICGRVCPQENQCEKFCVRAKKGESVAIGLLERFVSDFGDTSTNEVEAYTFNQDVNFKTCLVEPNGKKIAIVGSGPAGLSCAGDLAVLGYTVTVFEALHDLGGVLLYGIPEFRLPKHVVMKEIHRLKNFGVEFKTNMVIGKILTLDEILSEYSAVFVGVGAGAPKFMGIKGENLNGVYSANEFLTRVNLMKAYKGACVDTPLEMGKDVIVVGGGNVAMDVARCARRLGAQTVTVVYRRSENEMPARAEEVLHAKNEGIIFKTLTNPVAFINKNGWVTQIECVETELKEDGSGVVKAIDKLGTNFLIDAQTVIVAIGQSPSCAVQAGSFGLQLDRRGCVITDCGGRASKKWVYAGGDIVTGAATVILAMAAGKLAAKSMHQDLSVE